jgi:hypothetical protein
LRPALTFLAPGGVVSVVSAAPSLRQDLPDWCRSERHEYLGREELCGHDCHRIARGAFSVPRPPEMDGAVPERADPKSGFAPRGAWVEPGGPAYPFRLLERDRVLPSGVGLLYEQAVRAQWDAGRDIPWDTVKPLPRALDAALSQVMTFLAENELAALYVPAGFLPRIHPAYVEVAMFLATQLTDESRHIDVFLRRARAGGAGLGVSAAVTSHSLLTLLELGDFAEAAFLLSVLGEGTFLDLLHFIESHAPDEATAELTRRARTDEARHVHFGLIHVKHGLENDPTLFGRLEAAVRRRASALGGAGVPAHVQDALTILAAGGTDPRGVARGHEAFRELLTTMHQGRVKRLLNAGFTAEQADLLSGLHTPNFM